MYALANSDTNLLWWNMVIFEHRIIIEMSLGWSYDGYWTIKWI